MIDASYELQIAIVGRLKAYPALTALIADRVYDDVPRGVDGQVTATFPYVSLGPDQVLPDDFDCIAGSEIFLQIDAWSRNPGHAEAKKIASAVRAALHNHEFPLAENALLSLEFDSRRVFRDPDGKTTHAALIFKAVVEHD